MRTSLAAALLLGACAALTAPASAAGVGVHVGDVGIGFGVSNGHYYDRRHHRQAYSYPSDWKTYHHPQSWYRSHSHWNDEGHSDYYRH